VAPCVNKKGDRIIGFEDSPRGLTALLGTQAEGVLITSLMELPEIKELAQEVGKDFTHFHSFVDLLEMWKDS